MLDSTTLDPPSAESEPIYHEASPIRFNLEPLKTDPSTSGPKRDSDAEREATRAPLSNRFVEFFEVIKAYPNPYGDDFVVVDGFNLVMREGEVVSVIGHSGCGKSTMLTMLAGLNDISSGGIAVAGREIHGPGPDRAVVFQAPCLLPWMTSFQNVMLGVDRVYPHAKKAERRQLVEYYLSAVGLADSMHKYPREMSGGMQQRVGIARAIALKPKMLLLDEPFGRLDSLTRMELQDVILDILNREKVTTLLVTHDVDEAIYMSDRICMMTNGPRAKVGQVLDISFERPRKRTDVLEHPDFYDLRGCLISFLEGQEHQKATPQKDESMVETRTNVVAVGGEAPMRTAPLVRAVEIWKPTKGGGFERTEGIYRNVPAFEEASHGIAFDAGTGLPGAVATAGHPVVVDDLVRGDFLRSEAAAATGLTAGIGIPVFAEGKLASVVLLFCADYGDAKGAFEVWLPDHPRREMKLGPSYYANLDRFRKISECVAFPTGSGMPGNVWASAKPATDDDLANSRNFIRSSGAEADGLARAIAFPVRASSTDTRAVVLALSPAERPLGRVVQSWTIDDSGAWTLERSTSQTCPALTAAVDAGLEAAPGLPQRVADERSVILTGNLAADWPSLAEAINRDGLEWGLAIPIAIESDGRVRGVLAILD